MTPKSGDSDKYCEKMGKLTEEDMIKPKFLKMANNSKILVSSGKKNTWCFFNFKPNTDTWVRKMSFSPFVPCAECSIMVHEDTEIEQVEIPEVTLFYELYTSITLKKIEVGLHYTYTHKTLIWKWEIYSVYEFLFQK